MSVCPRPWRSGLPRQLEARRGNADPQSGSGGTALTETLYDAIVVGGGPAGLTAALYLARAKYRVLVLERGRIGGQIAITDNVVNYPGIPSISGTSLTETMKQQAEGFGAEFRQAEALDFELHEDVKTVHTGTGDFRCLGLLLATGAHPRTVGFRGEDAYKGRGVAYCATCDGEFFTGKDVFVVGGGYAAAEESVFLTKFARHVTILIRKDDFSCAASVAEQAKTHKKITVLTNTVLEEVAGGAGLTYARYKNTATGEVTEYRSPEGEHFGVFVFAGYAPETARLRGVVALDEQGYILTDAAQKTNVAGVYAAGDVCIKPLRQVVTATGDGAIAATELEKHIAAVQRQTGLRGTPRHMPEAPSRMPQADDRFPVELRQEMAQVFQRMEQPLILKLYLDERPVSRELQEFATALSALTDKLTTVIAAQGADTAEAPCVRLCRTDGSETGLAFHGTPGGHELGSFVLGLYNAAGAGQPIGQEAAERIAALGRFDLKILVTLSCGMCPETVTAAQKIASMSPNVTAEVYDIRLFPALQERYRVMSVPCLVLDGERTVFGKKNLDQILTLLEET